MGTMWVRQAGGKGCLKSRGPFQLLEKSATSGCATFKILGKEFRSVDEPGHCLDYFHGRGWGLWGCHKGQNQQFLQTGSKWCIAGGHCVESAPTTITTSTTRAATTVVTTTTPTTTTTSASVTSRTTATMTPTRTTTLPLNSIQSGETVFLKAQWRGTYIDIEGTSVHSRWQSKGNRQAIRLEKEN